MKHFIIYAILSAFIIFLSISFYFAIEEYVVDREFGKCYASIQSFKKDLLEEDKEFGPRELILSETAEKIPVIDVSPVRLIYPHYIKPVKKRLESLILAKKPMDIRFLHLVRMSVFIMRMERELDIMVMSH